ncbi:MAG: recombination mediator RecR [Methyloversatilis sp.]|nr:recombination mediator RecR [Methyloversatilis sp.]
MTPGVLDELVNALRCLPSVGPKSAQRMAFHLLQRDRQGAEKLARALGQALTRLHNCARCNTFTELEVCERCASPRRDASLLCVVESPADMLMMEQTQSYAGLYYCLMGRIAPLEGVGPRELRLDRLLERAADPQVTEVILATNPSMEGDATALYIGQRLAPLGVSVTRLARGLPMGGDLEYADQSTLLRALQGRQEMN